MGTEIAGPINRQGFDDFTGNPSNGTVVFKNKGVL